MPGIFSDTTTKFTRGVLQIEDANVVVVAGRQLVKLVTFLAEDSHQLVDLMLLERAHRAHNAHLLFLAQRDGARQ